MSKKAKILDYFRSNVDNSKKKEFFLHYVKGKKILELGAKTDSFLVDLKTADENFDVNAIKSLEEKTIFKKRGNVKMRMGRLQHIFSKEKYNAIAVWNFSSQDFKNYWELENMLRTCSKRIETDGALVLDVIKPQNIQEEFFYEDISSVRFPRGP